MDQNGNQPCRLTRTAEGLIYTGESLTYRITGLTSYNLDRLRVTLKASIQQSAVSGQSEKAESRTLNADSCFHIDTIDLYSSRFRETFAEACAKYLKVQQSAVMAELSQLIASLEAERVTMREGNNKASATPTMSDKEKAAALEALTNKDLLKMIVGDFDAIGFIGEKINKLIAYIAAVSRLLSEPLAVLILSRSGAGKTALQNVLCKFVPPEFVIQYTRLTG
jgi:hypothetical protein